MSNFPNPNAIDLTVIKGDTGATGTGANGATYYPYIAYATSAIGAGWSLTVSGKSYFAIVYSDTLYEPITESEFNAYTPQWIDFTEDIATLWNLTAWTSAIGTMATGWTNSLSARKTGDYVEFKGTILKSSSGTSIAANADELYDTGLNVPSGYEPSSLRAITLTYVRAENIIGGDLEFKSISGYVSTSGDILVSKEYIFGSITNTVYTVYFDQASYYTT